MYVGNHIDICKMYCDKISYIRIYCTYMLECNNLKCEANKKQHCKWVAVCVTKNYVATYILRPRSYLYDWLDHLMVLRIAHP